MGFYSNMPIASARRAPAHFTTHPRVKSNMHTLGTTHLQPSGLRYYNPEFGGYTSSPKTA